MIITERYSNPTRYDIAPYGSIYKHDDKLFIQVSKDPEVSEWLTIGDFLVKTYIDNGLKEDFIKQSLLIYENKKGVL